MTASARTWPFRRPAKNRISGSAWTLGDGSGAVGEHLDDWDPGTDLRVTRSLKVDVSGCRADTGLPSEAALRLVATWWCEGTTLRGVGTRIDLPVEGIVSIAADLHVPAALLAGTVHLQASVVLAGRQPRRPVTAWIPGSVLWEDAHALRLEGGGARFPMDAISFLQSGPAFPAKAAWRLEWEPDDLELPVLGSVQLHLNTDHPQMARVVASPDDPGSRFVVAAMQFDVARTLLRGALERDDFVDRKDAWPADSVGKALERLLKQRFPGYGASVLRAKLRSSPETFDALLQDRLGLFRGVE